MRFVYLVPNDGGFYATLMAITRVAAERLGVEVEVIDCDKRRERMVELARGLASRRPRPDCVFLPNYKGVGHQILPDLDAQGIATFVLVEGMTPTDLLALGSPRAKLRRWLGELYPDDVAVGQQLARLLVDEARAKGLAAADGKLHVSVLAGDQTPAGQQRFHGWVAFKKDRPEVIQASVQYAGWEEAPAREVTARILRSHPEVSVIWAANDEMALGALQAIREAGRTPGKDILVGGVDLSRAALLRIADGSLAVSLGGHMLDGARALLLVHDHLQGRDFEPWIQRSTLEPVAADQAGPYLRYVEDEGWRKVDYERFSRARSGADAVPALSLSALVQGWPG